MVKNKNNVPKSNKPIYVMIIEVYKKKYNYLFENNEDFRRMVDDIIGKYYDPILDRAYIPSYKDISAVRSSDWQSDIDRSSLLLYVASLCSVIYKEKKLGSKAKNKPNVSTKNRKDFLKLYELIYRKIVFLYPGFNYSLDDVKNIIIEEKNKYISELLQKINELNNKLKLFELTDEEKIKILEQISELQKVSNERHQLIDIGYGFDDENPVRNYDKWNIYMADKLENMVSAIAKRVYKRVNQKNSDDSIFLSLYDVILSPNWLDKNNRTGKTQKELQDCILKIINFCLDSETRKFMVNISKFNKLGTTKKDIIYRIRRILYQWILYGDKIFENGINFKINLYGIIFCINGDCIADNHQNRKIVDSILRDNSCASNEEYELLFKVFKGDFCCPASVYNGWNSPLDKNKLKDLLLKIHNILINRISILCDYETTSCALIAGSLNISLDELKKIFPNVYLNTKSDAEVMYWVIQLNGMWNNDDFMRRLDMSYDEVLDRVSKILNNHINSRCCYDSGKLYEMYKICLNFINNYSKPLVKRK